jgi:hypothetical protein
MNSSTDSSARAPAATAPQHTVKTIFAQAIILSTRGLALIALYVSLGFAQFVNAFFFALIFIFILAPGHLWETIYLEAEEEDIVIPGREGRRDTDDISDFDLNGDDRLGWAFDSRGNFSRWLDRESEKLRERRARRECVGSWLERLEEEAVDSESDDEAR